MLLRRQLRVKVMQALYAFFQDELHDMKQAEKELNSSFDRLYDLYVCQLLLFPEIAHLDEVTLQDVELKYLPTKEEKKQTHRLFDNKAISILDKDEKLRDYVKKRKITWKYQNELVQKLYQSVKKSPEYKEYLQSEPAFENQKELLLKIYHNYILGSDRFQSYFEEIDIYWEDDKENISGIVVKTIKNLKEGGSNKVLQPLFRNEMEDREFSVNLLNQTIYHEKEFERDIAEKIKNWELERLALIDIILLKMAMAEILFFPEIPVKVSMNEYIDIAKYYSTPKSSVFINGIIDRLVAEKRKEGKINKAGRGLIE